MPSVEAARQHNVSAAAFSLAINTGKARGQVITKSPQYRAPGEP
jgi:hypothetical protein